MDNKRMLRWGDYRMGFRRHWKLLLMCTSIGLLIGLLAALLVPPAYTAQTRVLVRPAPADAGPVVGGRTATPVNLDTEAQVARSREVAQRVAAAPGVQGDPSELAGALQVSVPPNSTVLLFRFTDADEDRAVAGANAFAEAYLQNRQEVSDSLVAGQVAQLAELIADVNTELAATDDPILSQQLTDERSALIASQQQTLATAVSPGRVIDQAQTAASSQLVNPASLAIGGVAAGALIGLAIVFARIRREDLVATGEELQEYIPSLTTMDLVGRDMSSPENTRNIGRLVDLVLIQHETVQLRSLALVAASDAGIATAEALRKRLTALLSAKGCSVSNVPGAGAFGSSGIAVWTPQDTLSSPKGTHEAASAGALVFVGVCGVDRRAEVDAARTSITTVLKATPLALVSASPGVAAQAAQSVGEQAVRLPSEEFSEVRSS